MLKNQTYFAFEKIFWKILAVGLYWFRLTYLFCTLSVSICDQLFQCSTIFSPFQNLKKIRYFSTSRIEFWGIWARYFRFLCSRDFLSGTSNKLNSKGMSNLIGWNFFDRKNVFDFYKRAKIFSSNLSFIWLVLGTCCRSGFGIHGLWSIQARSWDPDCNRQSVDSWTG